MKALVTGASGKFAPHLVRDLLNNGHEVVLFSRKPPAEEFNGLEWAKGDINNFADCYNAVHGKGFDAIHNTAAVPSPTDRPDDHARYNNWAVFPLTIQTNIIGLYNMLQAAVRNKVGIFVNTGSNCALGHGFRISDRPFEIKYLPIDEEHPSDCEDSYSFSKLAGEMLMETYVKAYGIRCYSLRPSSIIGEDRRNKHRNGASPRTRWDPWLCTWIASEDLASAHRLLMEKANTIAKFGVYYCVSDDTFGLEPTMEMITTYRPDLLPLIREPLDGYAGLFSNKKLKETVGWKPEKSWR